VRARRCDRRATAMPHGGNADMVAARFLTEQGFTAVPAAGTGSLVGLLGTGGEQRGKG
jgi:hypothetical protein